MASVPPQSGPEKGFRVMIRGLQQAAKRFGAATSGGCLQPDDCTPKWQRPVYDVDGKFMIIHQIISKHSKARINKCLFTLLG